MIGGRRISWITGHTQNIQTPRVLSLAAAQDPRLATQSVTDPHTQPTQPLTFSAHTLTAEAQGPRRAGARGESRATQTPHTTAAPPLGHDVSALERPSQERSWRLLGGVQKGSSAGHTPFLGRQAAWKPF